MKKRIRADRQISGVESQELQRCDQQSQHERQIREPRTLLLREDPQNQSFPIVPRSFDMRLTKRVLGLSSLKTEWDSAFRELQGNVVLDRRRWQSEMKLDNVESNDLHLFEAPLNENQLFE